MKGLAALLAMRAEGFKPPVVFFETDACKAGDWARGIPALHLQIEAREVLRRIDFRPFVGLVVVISGGDSSRVSAAAAGCAVAGAARVLTSVRKGHGPLIDLDEITDTEGVFVCS